jgi:protein gp37
MGRDTEIIWAIHSANFWRGCTKVSPGCANCYAERHSVRNPAVLGVWGDAGTRVAASESYMRQPLAWDRAAAKAGRRDTVFALSLGDVWEDRPDLVGPRTKLLEVIDRTPNLTWLLLSKRPGNWAKCLRATIDGSRSGPGKSLAYEWLDGDEPDNVAVGISIEDQKAAADRWPRLLEIPARLRFASCEPLLGPLNLEAIDGGDGVHNALRGTMGVEGRVGATGLGRLDWVIVGGESGTRARPMHPDWVRSIRDQCIAAKVPFMVKQWGEWVPGEPTAQAPLWRFQNGEELDANGFPAELTARAVDGWQYDIDGPTVWRRVGRAAAGRMLDEREWLEFPSQLEPKR